MVRAETPGSGWARALLALALLPALVVAWPAGPAAAGEDYTRTLGHPCIACHTSGGSPDLNQRGQAFANAPDHKADPKASWASAEQAFPLQQATGGDVTFLVPIAVLILVLAWGYVVLRRRSQPRPSDGTP